MPRPLKEVLSDKPPIDRYRDFDESPEYANMVIDQCARFFTLAQIEAHTGISRRLVSYMRHRGFNNFSNQLTLEILGGIRKCGK